MKITDIRKQETRDRYNVFVADEFAVALSAEVLVESGFRVGDDVTEEQLSRFGQRDAYSKLLTKALGFVSRRPHSRGELATKLTKPDTPPELVEDVLERMAELGYVDDTAFARQWISERGPKRGPTLLKQELYRKQVAEEVISAALAEFAGQHDETDAAYELAVKRWSRLAGQPNADQRLTDYLLRRGYSYDTVKTVRARLSR